MKRTPRKDSFRFFQVRAILPNQRVRMMGQRQRHSFWTLGLINNIASLFAVAVTQNTREWVLLPHLWPNSLNLLSKRGFRRAMTTFVGTKDDPLCSGFVACSDVTIAWRLPDDVR